MGSLIWFVMRKPPIFSLLNNLKDISCDKVRKAVALPIIIWTIIKKRLKLHKQIEDILIGTNCAPLVADMFIFCYERDFMLSFSDNSQADVIETLNINIYTWIP